MTERRALTAAICLAVVAAVAAAGVHAGSDWLGFGPAGRAGMGGMAGDADAAGSGRERQLAAALRRGVARAAKLGGRAEAAAMLDGSGRPLLAASTPRGAAQPVRMWSMSKVVTAIALLQALRWGDRAGEPLPAEVEAALHDAIVRSENCRQRRIVLELQRRLGGTAAVRRAFAGVLATAGAQARVGAEIAAPEAHCLPFLGSQTEIDDPFEPTLLLGISTWQVGDAARLAHALADGAYGGAISEWVLGLMREPKQPSREALDGQLTAPADWGAGVAFAGLGPAYKAGWGGSLNGNFLAGQLAAVPVGGGDHLAIAVIFHPDVQPPRDDPGITAAPAALQAAMATVRSEGRLR